MENDIKKLIKEVLEKGYLMSLGTQDEGGVWVCDVIYVFDDDFNLYWMSTDFRRHSKAIEKNPQVAVAITVSARDEKDFGIQINGQAAAIKEKRYDLAVPYFTKRGQKIPKEDEDFLGEHVWYVLKPKKIELICQEFFGFEKQKLEL